MNIKNFLFWLLMATVGWVLVGCNTASWLGGAQISNAQQQAYQAELFRLQNTPEPQPSLNYYQDVKPIVDRKCIVCHACYDAPCQLKLTSLEGILRGATQAPVYNASRIDAAPTTRLFIDAYTQPEWREKGFFSVLEPSDKAPSAVSVMNHMLALGRTREMDATTKVTKSMLTLGSERELSCAAGNDIDEYARENPNGGMPLAVAGLSDREYSVLTQWTTQAANNKNLAPPAARILPEDQKQLDIWESWFNRPGKKQQLLSRYLFEHFILGHLYFQSDAQLKMQLEAKGAEPVAVFFKLIRSTTPPGKPPVDVATVLANEPPPEHFYYRFVPVTQTLVYKDHIPYRLDQKRLAYFESHFLTDDWQVDVLPGYSYQERANPFITFAAIPAKLRYQFLLQDAEYFIRNFIRGPVCHGPIATDVIRDQFWVMFENPAVEQYVNDEDYRRQTTPLLGLPGEKDALIELGDQWLKYSRKRNAYAKMRDQHYSRVMPDMAPFELLWDGNKNNKNAFLSVFRHHDNASVVQGFRGNIPRTAWLMDYPLLERSYYELVVGFNVFGNTSHQLQTRLYFDLIRNGGEVNFLRLLPPEARQKEYEHWYQGAAKIKVFGTYFPPDFKHASPISYTTKAPKAEFFTHVFSQFPLLAGAQEFAASGFLPGLPLKLLKPFPEPDAFNGLRQKTAEQLPFIQFLPETTLLSLKHANGSNQVFSILRNRMHSNVAFMLGESLRYQQEQDTVTILPELVGSYPNLMLSVTAKEVTQMLKDITEVETQKDFDLFIDRYGVRRMQPRLWTELDGYRKHLEQVSPIAAGVMDINRYGYW